MANWVIERLDKSHDRAGFSCGKPALDAFLKTLVSQYEKKRLGRTFVATRPGEKQVLGYYTAATGSLAVTTLALAVGKRLPKHPLPTAHLGRLAVDVSCRGQGLGWRLLYHFLSSVLEVSARLGLFAVDVWAIDDEARTFYATHGFRPLEDAPLHLYLPIQTIEQMFAS